MGPIPFDHASDRGDVLLGWMTRLVLTFAILGLIGFEVMSVVVAQVQVQDIGQSAAQAAIDNFRETRDPRLAFESANAYAEAHGSEIRRKSFAITSESVSFDVTKTAPTVLLFRWSRTADLAKVETKVYAEPAEIGGQLS